MACEKNGTSLLASQTERKPMNSSTKKFSISPHKMLFLCIQIEKELFSKKKLIYFSIKCFHLMFLAELNYIIRD